VRPGSASRKLLGRLQAQVEDGAVQLRFYMSTPFFRSVSGRKRRPNIVIRIFRRAEPGFVFGEDYAEYFDGATPRAKNCIFEGALLNLSGPDRGPHRLDVELGGNQFESSLSSLVINNRPNLEIALNTTSS